jgi:diguanylate cyclase (GGDEF)-like protein
MNLRNRVNIIFFLVIAAVGVIIGFSFLIVYTVLSGFEKDYNFVIERLNMNIYALMIVSALTAISGVLIFRGLMSRILSLIEEVNRFTQNMIQGKQDSKLTIRGSDELNMLSVNLNRMADSYREKISVLENTMSKRQRAVRELQILNELTSFVISELDFEAVLKNFANRTSDLIKSEHCSIIIFEPDSLTSKTFVTKDGVQDPSRIHIDPEGIFKNLLKDFVPLRLSAAGLAAAENTEKNISIPELNVHVKDILALPLIFSAKLTGLFILSDKVEGTFDLDDEDTLMSFSFHAFQTIAMHDEITNLAITDGLTGLYNHRNFQKTLIKAVDYANRYETSLSLLIIDVDNFKTFNDIYGHQVGDVVLKSIASLIAEEIRKTDFAARYGGEEFAVIMPETNYNGARILAERLRTKINDTPFVLPDGDKALIAVSIGFASMPENTQDRTQLIAMADKAMYLAKSKGRNLSFGIGDNTDAGDAQHEESSWSAPYTFENLADLVDSKTPYMKGHSQEVSKLSMILAKEIGLNEGEIENIRVASILHDVGTINIPSKLLNKPDKLTEEEKKIIKSHPSLAEMILKRHPKIYNILPVILYHHERFDGTGYPLGISGEDIPLHARILAIAEAFHAMISPRPYREKISIEYACKELQANAGSQFDPHLVDVFVKTLKAKNYSSKPTHDKSK